MKSIIKFTGVVMLIFMISVIINSTASVEAQTSTYIQLNPNNPNQTSNLFTVRHSTGSFKEYDIVHDVCSPNIDDNVLNVTIAVESFELYNVLYYFRIAPQGGFRAARWRLGENDSWIDMSNWAYTHNWSDNGVPCRRIVIPAGAFWEATSGYSVPLITSNAWYSPTAGNYQYSTIIRGACYNNSGGVMLCDSIFAS